VDAVIKSVSHKADEIMYISKRTYYKKSAGAVYNRYREVII